MDDRVHLETLRLTLQEELDSKKTSLERNRLGQYATPTLLAREMLSYSLNLISPAQKVSFLDPAFGTGSFYSALVEKIGNRSFEFAKGYEIDPHYGEPAQEFWSDFGIDVELADFTQAIPQKDGFNLLICNPPYVRHHHLSADVKKRLRRQSEEMAGVKLSGLSGLYCYFMAMAHGWMSDGGIAGWLVPSEFMDVNYGRELKRYLLKDVTLLRIHRFDSNNIQFDDALVSSAVVWIKNAPPPINHEVEFSFGGTHATPLESKLISSLELTREDKWTRFPRQAIREAPDSPVLSDLFTIKRGIATGNNKFFILSREKIKELDLPKEFFRPILPSPRYVKADEIEADGEGNPILPQALFLLDCRLPEDDIKKKYPNLWNYLESGKEQMVSRYLCRSRPIWYKQELRLPTSFICTYMGRSDTESAKPFRFLLNHSQAIAANSYLMLYPKEHVAERLYGKPNLIRTVWEELNKIHPESLINEGRTYGGGLHKMEPKELAKVSAIKISAILNL